MADRPPIPLALAAIAYISYEVWVLFDEQTVTVGVRLVLSLVLFFFVLRGNRPAGILLAVLCILAALVCIWGLTVAPQMAVFFGASVVLTLSLASYLIFSPSVRAFQQRSQSAIAPGPTVQSLRSANVQHFIQRDA